MIATTEKTARKPAMNKGAASHKGEHQVHKHHASEKKQDLLKQHRHKKGKDLTALILGILAILAIVVSIIYFMPESKQEEEELIVATVNGEKITAQDIESQWNILPDEFKAQVTRDIILEQTIEKALLLQDAQSKGIIVSDKEANDFVDELLQEAGFSRSYLESQLKERDMTMDDIVAMYKEQLIVITLINQTIFPNIQVSEEELEQFYQSNKEAIGTSLEESREQLILVLKTNKQAGAIQEYVEMLKSQADIEIFHIFGSQ